MCLVILADKSGILGDRSVSGCQGTGQLVQELFFYHYGAEIPIEEIPSSMAVPNGHWESI